jgi:hypothetical protein
MEKTLLTEQPELRSPLELSEYDSELIADVESAFETYVPDRVEWKDRVPMDKARHWLGRAAAAGHTLADKTRDGYSYLNTRLGLNYGAVVEKIRAKAAASSETSSRFGSAKVWLMGAVAVNMVVSRTHGFGLLDGVHDAAIGGHGAIYTLGGTGVSLTTPTVETDYQPLSVQSELPLQSELPVRPEATELLIQPDQANPPLIDWDSNNNGVNDWVDLKNNIRAGFNWLSSWFVDNSVNNGPVEAPRRDDGLTPPPDTSTPSTTPSVPPPVTEVPNPNPNPNPGNAAEPGVPMNPTNPVNPDGGVVGGAAENHNFDIPPQNDEYLWNYMHRVGVPDDVIMRELDEAATRVKETTGSKVEWHGSGTKRWLEIDGKSDSVSLWRILQNHLKEVAKS